MSESSAPQTPSGLGENKAIRFHIKSGNARYQCVLQDRSAYERTKATRQNSTDSVSSTASTETNKSH
ncbi:hypothetical protein FZEAL_10381 [Fusarium zealandicum]|uniref:Uncharacterized protein n=1 Tax=Fusarium zealandicum TaxID=1053134 RepID=A0A8H4XBU6_9HYPO|nr:hypothetical protein FZEAL_10381 [Fusarium zealandicum]